ncbi:mechanosensitive ion channel [Gramella lutea]|uniref:Mechanosensitive ion channel n=1 Tax=Christiangramia lutea TaxID=1607951 RepID=A0A9X1V153_9FLAO|nr:mechanosensitive ion channel domain-containing protein [Christiangramia lutea]MCH4822243.1 mechanosensitive ion channel [Christiangramia lutea]
MTRLIPFLFFLALPFGLSAQVLNMEQDNRETDTIGQIEPEAIPLSRIVQELETTREEIKSNRNRVERNITEADSLFPIYEEFLNEQKQEVAAFLTANPNKEKIDNIIIKWEGFNNYLKSWQSEINESERKNSLLLETIEPKEDIWVLSYESALEEDIPEKVLLSIEETIFDIRALKDTIFMNNYDLLSLESQVNQEINETNSVIDELRALKRSEVYRIFHQRHPALWNTSFRNIWAEAKSEDGKPLEITRFGVRKFIDNTKATLPLFLFLMGLITFLILYSKRTLRKYPFERRNLDLQRAKNVFSGHYISAICFLSLLLARYYFVPLPKLFLDISILLLLVFAVPLVLNFMHKRYRRLILFAILFYVINSVKTHVWFNSEQYRIYLLIEAILLIAVLIFFINPHYKKTKGRLGDFGTFLLKLVPILFVLGLIAIVSNILGYTNLTDLSLKIATRSGVFVILFYVLLVIINAVFLSIIHRHYVVKNEYDVDKKIQTEKKALRIIRVLIIIFWLLAFLNMIDQFQPLVTILSDFLSEPYKIGDITFTLQDIFSFLLVLFIAFALTRIVSFLLNDEDGMLRIFHLPKGYPAAISLIIRYLIIGFGVILALSSLGIDLSKFNLMAGALGLGIGFGLQTVISNFVSGMILVFERPIIQGDTVEVDNLLGIVNRIGVRSSSITTFDGAEVIVPNNNLISNDLINWTLSNNTKRVEIFVGTTYSSDPNEVLKILFTVAEGYKHTLKNPPPQALFVEFGDSSLNFTLRFWVHYENWLQARSDISIEIYNQFKKANIQIPFPQRDIYIKSMPGSSQDPEPKDKPDDTSRKMEDTDIPEVITPIEHREPDPDVKIDEKKLTDDEDQEKDPEKDD